VGIVTSAEPFVYFIAKSDSGLPAKVAVTVGQGSKVFGALFVDRERRQASGRYQMLRRYRQDENAKRLVQEALDEILSRPGGGTKSELLNMSKVMAILERDRDNKRSQGSRLSEEGSRSLGDLSGCDAVKLTAELRDRSAHLSNDPSAQEAALDQPYHLFFFSAVDPNGMTRFFDLMPQTDGISIAETAIAGTRLGPCVETVYSNPGGGTHHVHRLYGKFRASTPRQAMEDFAKLTRLSQVTEIAETQTQREALPTWKFIFESLGQVTQRDPRYRTRGNAEKALTTSTEVKGAVEGTLNAIDRNRLSDAKRESLPGKLDNETSPVTRERSESSRSVSFFNDQPKPEPLASDNQNSGHSKKAYGTYRWALVYGWFVVAAAAYLLVVAALKLLGVQDSAPAPSSFAHSQAIGTAAAMFQGLLWLGTGLAILQRRLIAIRLMWAVVILAGLGVLVRGIVPLDLLIWILSVLIAKWFSTKREFLSEHGRPSVEMQKRALVEGQRDHWWTTLEPNAAKTPGQGASMASSRQETARAPATTAESRVSSRNIQRKIAIPLVVLIVIAILGLALRGRMSAKHPPTKPDINASPSPHLAPILIPGVQEPDEMRVEPFPTHVLTEPERMLAEAMNNIKDENSPDALLPALNRILAKYPDYGDGYTLRLISLCNGKDRAATLLDINSALKYKSNLENASETNVSILAMRAKIEHDEGDDVAAMRDLDAYIQANPADADRFTNSGAVAPEKTASACTWSETDMEAIKSNYPNDYRSYLYAGLYYGFFTTWDEKSVSPALENLSRAVEINPNSPLPHFFKAHVLRQGTFFKRLNMPDAQRADLDNRFLAELNLALALDPSLLPALSQRADVYFNLKQFQQAISDYNRVLAIDTKDAGAYNDRGLAKMELRDVYGAISDFSEAIRLKKRVLQESSSHENRADAYLKTQQWNLAIRDLTTAISLKTGGISLLMNINQFRALYPEYKPASDEAIARKLNQTFYPDMKYEDFAKEFLHDNVEKGFETSTVIPDLYLKRADAYLTEGDWYNGAADFRRAINGFPQYANAVDRWRKIDTFQEFQIYLDLQSFDDSVTSSIKLWTKEEVDYAAVARKFGGVALEPEHSAASRETSEPYSLRQYEFDCDRRQLRQLSFARYSAFGRLLSSRGSGPWESPIPDTLGESLFNPVCMANKRAAN
jgi:tetratricopeptide (TPR) repeat protein